VTNSENTLVVGKIGAPHGVKGWVRITSYTEKSDGIFDFSPWKLTLQGTVKEYKVIDWKHQNKHLLARIEGVDTRDDAELIKNAEIRVDEALLPELDKDEFYWRDLIGLSVVSDKGYNLGKVEQLFETGANDVMLVKANVKDAFGMKQRMIPYLFDQVVKQVDLESAVITVDWDPSF
jgi:16S rRNA processing protein RimM